MESITDEAVTLKLCDLFAETTTFTIDVGEFVKKWFVAETFQPQQKVPLESLSAPGQVSDFGALIAKHHAWEALWGLADDVLDTRVGHYKDPVSIRANVDIPAGKLQLYPFVSLDNLSSAGEWAKRKKRASGSAAMPNDVVFRHGGAKWFCEPMARNTTSFAQCLHDTKSPMKSVTIPFWWVMAGAKHATEFNLTMSTVKRGAITVPVITNPGPIKNMKR